MHDSRKTFITVLLDNILNIFNISVIVFLIIFIINKSYIYLIPLVLSLIASFIRFAFDVKHYLVRSKFEKTIHVLVDGQETEKRLSRLKIGDHVVLYPQDRINFVGKVINGVLFVDEKSITGKTGLIKKIEGASVVKDSLVIQGKAVVEVTELCERVAKKTIVQNTSMNNVMKIFNVFLPLVALLIVAIIWTFDLINKTHTVNDVAKATMISIPYLLNVLLVVFEIIQSKRQLKGLEVLDSSFFSELQNVDVVCLDKTGTITNGEYEIFKTVVISQSSLNAVSIDANRGLEQLMSNIIKTTKETGGYFSTLQESFVYDVTKIIDDSSPLSQNGLYSAITIHGGRTYALGEVENFDLANNESALNFVNEYSSMGYKVLMLVESKNPLKSGLIDGKPTGIALIVLQEKIRENIKQLIQYCLEHNKVVKVISGDRIATVSEVCRKAGLENTNKATSVKLMPFEKLELLVEEDLVFADASPSHKAFIVKQLQKNGHKVLYIGDGDNDTQALKTANAAISISGESVSAKKCSHLSVDKEFSDFNGLKKKSINHHTKLSHILSLTLSQASFGAIFSLVFFIASLINNAIYNPFDYAHLLMWTLFGVLIPSILIIVEPDRNDCKKVSFLRNYILETSLLSVIIGAIYVVQLLQYFRLGYYAIPSDITETHEILITSKVANTLAYLSLILTSACIVYTHMSPFNKYRIIALVSTFIIPFVYFVLSMLNIDVLSVVTQIDTSILVLGNYFAAFIIVAIGVAIYRLVISLFDVIKGDPKNAKN